MNLAASELQADTGYRYGYLGLTPMAPLQVTSAMLHPPLSLRLFLRVHSVVFDFAELSKIVPIINETAGKGLGGLRLALIMTCTHLRTACQELRCTLAGSRCCLPLNALCVLFVQCCMMAGVQT